MGATAGAMLLSTAGPAAAVSLPTPPKVGFTRPLHIPVMKHRDQPVNRAHAQKQGSTPQNARATAADGSSVSVVPDAPSGPPRSTWQVSYSGFDSNLQAKAAFQAAVDIWKRIVASPVEIKVDATFASLDPGVLGSAAPCAAYSQGIGDGNTSYASALADAVKGSDQSALYTSAKGYNPPAPTCDIAADFSSDPSAGFYFGTDGLPPAGKVDFESVVLHELGHGLGFGGSMDVSNGSGNHDSKPYAFDRFGYDSADGGSALLAQPNHSAELASKLQNGSNFWGGPKGVSSSNGARPRLYAPATWEVGSSFSHLDENAYPLGNANSLMTPYFYAQETIHNPGVITVGMFGDMGWDAALPAAAADTTAPTVTSTALAGVSLGNPTLRYSGTDSGSGIADYLLTYKVAPWNADFGPATTVTSTVTSQAVTVAKGSTLCFTAISRDHAGNASAPSPSRCTTVALDDRSLTRSAGWASLSSSAYYASTETSIVKAGATLTRTGVSTRKLSLVATKCATCGTVGVYWNGRLLKQISLYRSTTAQKQIVLAYDLGGFQNGTLVLKSMNGSRVSVDGVGLGRF